MARRFPQMKADVADVSLLARRFSQIKAIFHSHFSFLIFHFLLVNLFLLSIQSPTVACLSEEETHHCTKVLRHKEGDEIHGIDGKGSYVKGIIQAISKKETQISIQEIQENWGEKPQKIVLAISPLRQKDRFEWLIEKAVELGIDEIVPIICKNTITENVKPERLQQIIISATKQCKRAKIPLLHTPILVEKWLESVKLGEKNIGLLAFCETENSLSHYHTQIQTAKIVYFVIGPEGDFSQKEVEIAAQKGFEIVSLGKSRLRTETAGLFALSAIKLLQGW